MALALLARALRGIEGPVCIDLADAKTGVRAWLEASGFSAQRSFLRMRRDRRANFDYPVRTVAVMGPEFG